MKPSLTAWVIAKNESRDLPRCLDSIAGIADQIIVVDTGSNDETVRIAAERGCSVHGYHDASLFIDGHWVLQDFSKARNYAIEQAEKTGADWWMWMDADDELMHPQSVRRSLYLPAYDCFAIWMQDGTTRWLHHRLVKSGRGARFAGVCHEYLILDGLKCFTLDECTIRHDSAPGSGESSNARNLRMLTAEYERKPSPRAAFYLASTHKDGGRWNEAVRWYMERVLMGGQGHRDEWLFAQLYMARCQRAAGHTEAAEVTLESALRNEPAWAEFHMEYAFCAYHTGRYEEAITRAQQSPTEIPLTHLWREPTMYRDQPWRLMSWCHEHLNRMPEALQCAEIAARDIIGTDLDWNARIARLRSLVTPEAPALVMQKLDAIALCRPGAIGDILMTLNCIPYLREANPGKAIYYFCDAKLGAPDALGPVMRAAGVDVVMHSAQWPAWRDKFERAIDLVGYPLQEGYPEKPMRRHLLRYFAAEMGLDFAGKTPELTLRRPARPASAPSGDYLTLQTKTGWSRYKEWPQDRWREVVKRTDYPIVVIHEAEGRTLAESIALIANARMHVGLDSFGNHLTHFMWKWTGGGRRVPAVILWGSTQVSASGYPSNVNLSTGLACNPCFKETAEWSQMKRGPCVNLVDGVHRCMAEIGVDQVVAAVRDVWERAG